MDLNSWLSVFMRFIHIGSIAGLIGGALYARTAMTPLLNSLPENQRAEVARSTQARFRGLLYTLLALILLSGAYNLYTALVLVHHTSQWHMWFGIKFLAVLHILATTILWGTSPYGDATVGGKGKQRLTGLVISGFIVILISNYLRYLTAHNL